MPQDETSPDLATALAKFQIELSEEQRETLKRYVDALWDWNQRINLTRHTDYDRFVARDVVDARMLAEQLAHGEEVLDVGSGGGAPGIIVALLRPDLQLAMCESVGKKAQALAEITKAAGLPIPVYHDRAETILEDFRFDTLTLRAVGPMAKLLKWFEPHWSAFVRLLLIKGPKWVEERSAARHLGLMNELQLRRISSYNTPGNDVESVILEIRRKPAGK